MCYHQARSARFIGHCWGRGWRDATENLLQTSIINRLGSFPLRRICGTERSTTFIPLCESFQVGDSVAWGRGRGAEKTQTNKQNTGSKLQQHSNDDSRESWHALFFFVLETRINSKKERDHGRLWTNPHYYTNALHEKRWYARLDAPHSFRR